MGTGAARPRTAGVVAWGALGVVYVLWGSTYLGNRLVITDVPPLFAGGARFLVAGSLLTLVVLAVAGRRPPPEGRAAGLRNR